MKSFSRFLSNINEEYTQKDVNRDADKASAKSGGSIVSKGKKLGSIPRTAYEVYQMPNGNLYQVAMGANGVPYRTEKISSVPKSMVKEDVKIKDNIDKENLKSLISRFEKTGRAVHHYPKKKQISISGKTMSEKDAIATMKRVLGEEVTNSVSAGGIAGVSDNDPPVSQKKVLRRSKFAGTEVFEVDADTFHKCHLGHMRNERWNKYLKDDCEQCKSIHAYANRHPQKDIIVQREGSGEMTWLKKKGVHY